MRDILIEAIKTGIILLLTAAIFGSFRKIVNKIPLKVFEFVNILLSVKIYLLAKAEMDSNYYSLFFIGKWFTVLNAIQSAHMIIREVRANNELLLFFLPTNW